MNLALLLATAICSTVVTSTAVARQWNEKDSVSLRYFADGNTANESVSPGRERPIVPSPDGSRFLFITRRGDLFSDRNVYELHIFSVQHVLEQLSTDGRQVPKALRTLQLSSSNNASAIREPRWVDGEAAIVFKGTVDDALGAPIALYRFDVDSGRLLQLTDAAPLLSNGPLLIDTRGESALFADLFAVGAPEHLRPDQYPVSVVTMKAIGALAFDATPVQERQVGLFVSNRGKAKRVGLMAGLAEALGARGRISPDGTLAILSMSPRDIPIPSSWVDYDATSQDARTANARFMLVDIKRGIMRPVIEAPIGTATLMGQRSSLKSNVIWAQNGTRAILVNATLPLTGRTEHRSTAYIVDYEPKGGRWTAIAPLEGPDGTIQSVTRGQTDGELLIAYSKAASTRLVQKVYTLQGERWVPHESRVPQIVAQPFQLPADQEIYQPSYMSYPDAAATTFSSGLAVTLQEGPDKPQRLVASDGVRELALMEPDPVLDGLEIAPSRVVAWTEPDGHKNQGLLTLPPGRRPNAGAPALVIQLGQFMPNLFRPDGSYSSAYAVQALAARGMAVLGINNPKYERPESGWETNSDRTGLNEGQVAVQTVDAAVASLAAERLIDPQRVGLVGFSRNGYHALYVITHPGRTRIGAALAHDSFTAGYSDYLRSSAVSLDSGPGLGRLFEPLMEVGSGRGTFWQNKAGWLQESPEFNIDRVQTPFLYTSNGLGITQTILYTQMTGAFRLNQRPLELLNFPRGAHQLVRPKERLASLEATVDWMDFWLNSYEHPAPEKQEKYQRWRKMRAEWKATRSNQ